MCVSVLRLLGISTSALVAKPKVAVRRVAGMPRACVLGGKIPRVVRRRRWIAWCHRAAVWRAGCGARVRLPKARHQDGPQTAARDDANQFRALKRAEPRCRGRARLSRSGSERAQLLSACLSRPGKTER